jgi:serine/threonine-protein kinase RsbW
MNRRILIIDDHDDLAGALDEVFSQLGHEVVIAVDRRAALAVEDKSSFDLVITDLDSAPPHFAVATRNGHHETEETHVKAFKVTAATFRKADESEEELKELLSTVLDYKLRFVDRTPYVQGIHESIEFELPSTLSVMHIVLEYLVKRVERLEVVQSGQSNLFVALDEAFVNAVKHGNKFDCCKMIRIAAEISKQEARFTIEDEGEGFNVASIPDPLDPENLFKASGRGVLFIYNIMDEVSYNDRGNRLTMVKRGTETKVA